jgi:PAS domain S-box-containing protein
MTTERPTLSGGWIPLQGTDVGDAAASTATTELTDILDAVDAPVVVVRRDLTIAYFNRAAADVLGLLPSDMGRAPREVPALAGLPRLEERCTQVMTLGVETRADVRDRDRWFIVRVSPYAPVASQAVGAVLTITDVTAFRASIDQAIYERECTKAIVNAVADPLVVLSADQRIQSGNRAFYSMFGVSRDETQGVPLHELGTGAFALAPLRMQLDEILAGGHAFQPVEVEYDFAGRGQRTLMLDARPLFLPGHSERRVLVTFQDITARKQAEAAKDLRSEEELRRSEAFLAEAQRLSLTGSFSWRMGTDEITWSDQVYRIFDLDPAMPVTFERLEARVHPDDLALFRDAVDGARSDRSGFEYELRLLMPDHSVKHLHVVAHAARDRDGDLEYIGAVQDVTERRRAQEALDQARAELTRVARVTSLGMLTASIAHEVNQPLTGIVTNAGTCLRMLAADPPNLDGARETARRTIRDGHRASEVITRLRGLFAKKEVAIGPVDLNEATREVIALSTSELQRRRVILRLDLADDLPQAPGDRVQLQQVILNLLLNAADAMSGVDDRPRQLMVRTARDGDGVCLAVQDSGMGFAPEDAERLFEAFYTTKTQGMGIGLSVSRSIIERHRGRLWATPNEGPGATFAFTVPFGPDTKV